MVTHKEIIEGAAQCADILLTYSEENAKRAIAELYTFAEDKEPLRAFVQIVEVIYHERRA